MAVSFSKILECASQFADKNMIDSAEKYIDKQLTDPQFLNTHLLSNGESRHISVTFDIILTKAEREALRDRYLAQNWDVVTVICDKSEFKSMIYLEQMKVEKIDK